MRRFELLKSAAAAASGLGALAVTAAQAKIEPGGISLQAANSALAEEVHFFHNWVLMPIMTGICLLVLGLLAWVVFRYNSKANPTPRKFSHNTAIEIIWTGVPILILLIIALPSFDLLYKEDVQPDGKQMVVEADGRTASFVFANDFPERRTIERPSHVEVLVDSGAGLQRLAHRADYTLNGLGESEVEVAFETPPSAGDTIVIRGGRSGLNARGCGGLPRYFGACPQTIALAPSMTLKVNGYQWGWTYSYPDFGDFEFSSNMLPESETTPELYRLEVDNRVVVPVGETVRVTTTARDVIHSWAMPNFAIKIDAVPGRINETWFNADREGVYYGQCSEICGIKHAFMPIAVEVVSRPEFEAWIDEQRELAGMEPMFATDEMQLADAVASGK